MKTTPSSRFLLLVCATAAGLFFGSATGLHAQGVEMVNNGSCGYLAAALPEAGTWATAFVGFFSLIFIQRRRSWRG